MKVYRYILTALLLLTVCTSAVAQMPELISNKDFQPQAKAAVDSIYNFNFAGADQAVAEWQRKYPDHPLWMLFDGMQFWWQVLSDLEDHSNDKKLFDKMRKVNYMAGKLLHDQPKHADALIIMAISNGFLARQYANNEEWVTSINYGRKAMKAHEFLLEMYPGFDDLLLAEGLKLYYLAYIPEKYPIVKTVSWALPDGDKQKGLEYIRRASEEAIFARAEATYFLGNINYNYEENYELAVQNFEKLNERYPQNNYYARILVKSYFKQHSYDEALDFIDRSLKRWENNNLPFIKVMQEELWTWKGRILEKKGQNQQALEYYIKAFSASNELPNGSARSFYVVSSYLAGKMYYELDNEEKAREFLKRAASGKAEPGYREQAQNLLSKMS